MKRPTARELALPGMRAEANRRLRDLDTCSEDDVDHVAGYLAQMLRPDVQPDWEAFPVGAGRYDALRFRRKDQ